jgi:hypothetical protein
MLVVFTSREAPCVSTQKGPDSTEEGTWWWCSVVRRGDDRDRLKRLTKSSAGDSDKGGPQLRHGHPREVLGLDFPSFEFVPRHSRLEVRLAAPAAPTTPGTRAAVGWLGTESLTRLLERCSVNNSGWRQRRFRCLHKSRIVVDFKFACEVVVVVNLIPACLSLLASQSTSPCARPLPSPLMRFSCRTT